MLYEVITKLPKKFRYWLNQTVNLAGIALFATLGYLGYLQLMDERVLEITSESLNLPQWIYTTCIPVGCGLIVVRIIGVMVTDIRGKE